MEYEGACGTDVMDYNKLPRDRVGNAGIVKMTASICLPSAWSFFNRLYPVMEIAESCSFCFIVIASTYEDETVPRVVTFALFLFAGSTLGPQPP